MKKAREKWLITGRRKNEKQEYHHKRKEAHKVIRNKKTKKTFLIDIAVPNTHNLAKTITDKQNKYQEMANEICAMWKQKAVQVIPIVISSTAVIPKSLSQSLTTLNLHRLRKDCAPDGHL